MEKHLKFLSDVYAYVLEHPDVAAYVSDYVAQAIKDRLKIQEIKSADMEWALAMALTSKKKHFKTIKKKIAKWNKIKMCCVKWDWLFEDKK